MNFTIEDNRVYYRDASGKLLAEVTFPNISADVVEINHTFVDPSLRGKGIAGQLLDLAVKKIQQDGKKAKATCSYAIKWFEKHAEYQHLLID